MSVFLKHTHQPVVLLDIFYDFLLTLPEYSNVKRNINIPMIPESDTYIYSRGLFCLMLRVLTCLDGQVLSKSSFVYKQTSLTNTLLGIMVEFGDLQWGLFCKNRKIGKEHLEKEVSLKNLRKLSKYAIKRDVELVKTLPQFIEFLEEEQKYLSDVEYSLQHSQITNQHTNELPNTELKVIIPREDDLERAKFIETIINKYSVNNIENDINYDDYW